VAGEDYIIIDSGFGMLKWSACKDNWSSIGGMCCTFTSC